MFACDLVVTLIKQPSQLQSVV